MVPIPSDNGVPDLTNREILTVLLQEIMDVRRELKEDIANLDAKLSAQIDAMGHRVGSLEHKVDRVDKRLSNLEVKVDRNFICFMSTVDDLGRRVVVLEAK